MLVVGLTGGIASGKSTVSNLLRSSDLPLIDLDIIARQAVEPGSKALSRIQLEFGNSVIKSDGTLDREALGHIIFNNAQQRKKLNSIVHPAVRRLMARELVRLWLNGASVCIVDAPLLIEAGLWRYAGKIILVYCSEQLQMQRLKSRNNLSPEDAAARIRSQAPLSSKLTYADFVVDNSGSLSDLQAQVDGVIGKLKKEAGWSWQLSWWFPPLGIFRGILLILWRLYYKGIGSKKRARSSDTSPKQS